MKIILLKKKSINPNFEIFLCAWYKETNSDAEFVVWTSEKVEDEKNREFISGEYFNDDLKAAVKRFEERIY